MIEFTLILKASGKTGAADMFWRLLIGTVAMLAFGFMGETRQVDVRVGFCCGEAGGVSLECTKAVRESFNSMRLIVTAGWSIYPLGYVFGLMLGQADDSTLNIIYNIADFVNKIAFVLACWSAAKSDSEDSRR